MSRSKTSDNKYTSAWDIPSVRKMNQEMQALKCLRFVLPKDSRRELRQVEERFNALIETIDDFYELFSPNHWVFHDLLNPETIRLIIDSSSGLEEAEGKLVEMYDTELIKMICNWGRSFEAFRERKDLIEKARQDFASERYYSCVLVLLVVVDGFVNALEKEHKGLHARDSSEFDGWDSIVSHQKGLAHLHEEVYKKGFQKTYNQPAFELFRNGILHGMIPNFNNRIIAAKSWNLLAAVIDWARTKRERDKPKQPELTWNELVQRMEDNRIDKDLLDKWSPYQLDERCATFFQEKVVDSCSQFFSFWAKKQYGFMSNMLMNIVRSNGVAQMVKDDYSPFILDSYKLVRCRYTAPALCEIDVKTVVNGVEGDIVSSWIYESEQGVSIPAKQDGDWHCRIGYPHGFLADEQIQSYSTKW